MNRLIIILVVCFCSTCFSQDSVHYKEILIKLPNENHDTRMHYFRDEPFTGYILYPYNDTHYSQIMPVKGGKTHGVYKQYYSNGLPKLIGNYEFGKRDGLSTRWYENGQIQSKSIYEQGHLIDSSFRWWHNGQLKSWGIEHPRRTYTLEYHMFYKDGQKWTENTATSQKRWYPNGVLSFEGVMLDYKSHGKLKYYNKQGKIIKIEYYEHGKLLKTKVKRDEPTY